MTQYMMSVHTVEGEAMPTGDDMQRMYDQVDVFNQKLVNEGIWVFGGGLEPIETATTVDATGHETHPHADDIFTALEQQGRGDR